MWVSGRRPFLRCAAPEMSAPIFLSYCGRPILAKVIGPERERVFGVSCSHQLFRDERGVVTSGFAQIAAFVLANALCMRQRMQRRAWGDYRYD